VFIIRYIIVFIAAAISFWLAEKVIADNRIAPRETVSEQHTFTLPDNTSYPLTVDATLNYMSAPQELIDHLFGEGIHEVPVIAMVKASGKIPEKPVEAQAQATGFTASMALMVLAALTITLTIIDSYKKQ
jgi:hypothetical protein